MVQCKTNVRHDCRGDEGSISGVKQPEVKLLMGRIPADVDEHIFNPYAVIAARSRNSPERTGLEAVC